MLNQLSFRSKITVLIVLSVIMASVLSFAGYMGISKLDLAVNEQTFGAALSRDGMMADMMHDAINSDVKSALLAGSKPVIDPTVRDEVLAAIQEHVNVFRQQLETLGKSNLNPDEQKQFDQAKLDVDEYLKGGINTAKLAFQDHFAAERQLPVFDKQFKTLELSLGTLNDNLENKVKDIELRSTAIRKTAYTILFVSTLLGLALLIAVSLIIAQSIFGELGGEPHLIHTIAERISTGDISVMTPVKTGDTSSVMYAMAKMKQSLTSLINDTESLTATVMAGNLESRVDTDKHPGAFGQLLRSVDETLAATIEPLKMTADYIDKIAKGEIPPKITGFGGEVNTINTIRRNLNTTIDSLNTFVNDMQRMSDEHDKGDIEVVIDANKFQGSYKTMAQGVNKMVDGHIALNKKAMACVQAFGDGNFEAPLETFPGKKAFINETIEQVRNNLKLLIEDAYLLAEQAQEGNLSIKADANRHKGDFRKIIAGINCTLDSVIVPIQETIKQITQFSRGIISDELTSDFKGDFAELKKRLNNLSLTMKGVIDSCDYVKDEHDRGEIDIMIAADRFKGDFGKMATTINSVLSSHIDLNKKTIACVKAFGEGNFEAQLEPLPGKKAFINDTIEQVRSNLQGLISDTDMLSQAALDGRIQTRADASKHKGDFRKIIEGINATLETIVTPIVTVKSAVDSISTAAKEISAGNADLSHRTEQQAASLEETASSMEQLASTVKQNADNAKQANQMALAASDVAIKGGGKVQRVVETMISINESANKIVDIISVIDGIALQTNILALNAAVEAARAGEQGRGFAVVASEVRNLAQRSAAAAKEIKGLIDDSVEKVEVGNKLVNEAGKTMEEIVSSVKRVTGIMADIAAASQEQSSGIDQVNRAVTQMDEVTQQNAALVEQAAAAAESLEEQSQILANTVSIFHLDSEIQPTLPKRLVNHLSTENKSGSRLTDVPGRPSSRTTIGFVRPIQTSNDEWNEF